MWSFLVIEKALNIPSEGIFWVINGELIHFSDAVNPNDPVDCTALTHKGTWNHIKNDYLVGGKCVPYDYFPRGRVETMPIIDDSGNLICYDSCIYMDKCIDKKKFYDKIIDAFRLYIPKCRVTYEGQLFVDGSHYVCNNCRHS